LPFPENSFKRAKPREAIISIEHRTLTRCTGCCSLNTLLGGWPKISCGTFNGYDWVGLPAKTFAERRRRPALRVRLCELSLDTTSRVTRQFPTPAHGPISSD
jgi:hypothetical protein